MYIQTQLPFTAPVQGLLVLAPFITMMTVVTGLGLGPVSHVVMLWGGLSSLMDS